MRYKLIARIKKQGVIMTKSEPQHAKLSASGSERWLNCLGSVAMEAPYPRTTSVYAEEGTRAHELAEKAILSNTAPSQLTDDAEMARYVQDYIDYIDALKTRASTTYIEQKVSYEHITVDGFGTCDCAIIDNTHIHIVDLKYGKGVPVSAQKNTQLMLYAAGFIYTNKLKDIKTITLHVVQPRIPNYSEYTLTREYLWQFEATARIRAKEALQPDAPLKAGEKQCQWCKAKADCPALKEYTEQALLTDLDDVFEKPKVSKLTNEQKRKILDAKPLIIDFLKAVEDDVFAKLSAGEAFEGYKLIEGRSNRKWVDDIDAMLFEALGDKAFRQSIITITEAEKLLSKDTIAELTYKPDGQPKLVSSSHKSPAISVVDTSSLFDDV